MAADSAWCARVGLSLLLNLRGVWHRPALAAGSRCCCPGAARISPVLVAAVESARPSFSRALWNSGGQPAKTGICVLVDDAGVRSAGRPPRTETVVYLARAGM